MEHRRKRKKRQVTLNAREVSGITEDLVFIHMQIKLIFKENIRNIVYLNCG